MTSDSSPLTRADGKHILEVMTNVLNRFDMLAAELRAEMQMLGKHLSEEISGSERRVKEDFRRGIQIVREDVAGANADKLAQYQDRIDDHDRRIVTLEGVASGR